METWLDANHNVIDLLAKTLTALGVAISAAGLILNWLVRRRDLRWQQVTAARQALNDIHSHECAIEAVNMIDTFRWNQPYFNTKLPGTVQSLTQDQVTKICAELAGPGPTSEGERQLFQFVHRSFDWLAYYIDRFELLEESRLLKDEDCFHILNPYIDFLRVHREYLNALIKRGNYLGLARLVDAADKQRPLPVN